MTADLRTFSRLFEHRPMISQEELDEMFSLPEETEQEKLDSLDRDLDEILNQESHTSRALRQIGIKHEPF